MEWLRNTNGVLSQYGQIYANDNWKLKPPDTFRDDNPSRSLELSEPASDVGWGGTVLTMIKSSSDESLEDH